MIREYQRIQRGLWGLENPPQGLKTFENVINQSLNKTKVMRSNTTLCNILYYIAHYYL